MGIGMGNTLLGLLLTPKILRFVFGLFLKFGQTILVGVLMLNF